MREPEVHPKVFNSKIHYRFKPSDFKFCLGKLTNKMFPISSKVTFSILLYCFSRDNSLKIIITPDGENV